VGPGDMGGSVNGLCDRAAIGVGSSCPISNEGFVRMNDVWFYISISPSRLGGVSKRVSCVGGDMNPTELGLLIVAGSYSLWMLETSDTERLCGSRNMGVASSLDPLFLA